MIENQTCVVCGRYGCEPFVITERMRRTGDNLMPVCEDHRDLDLIGLFTANKRSISDWLIEHDRFDVLAALPQWH